MDNGTSYNFRIKKKGKKSMEKRTLPPRGTRKKLTPEQAAALAMQKHQIAIAYLKDH
jgi:hypothetical protein